MPHRLYTSQPDFGKVLERLLMPGYGQSDISASVAGIIMDVKQRGDEALLDYTRRFDRWDAEKNTLLVTESDFDKAEKAVSDDLKESLMVAINRVRDYHERQLPQNCTYTDDTGITLGWRWSALDSAGLYVPGGTASLPSSVYMNAIPAKVAGVKKLAIATPAPGGEVNPAVLVAARLCGITSVYKIGGAQAVAALAFGTQSVSAVCKVAGPGNAYVTEAKRQLFGHIGIDTIAGPSDVAIIADKGANPAWLAADLLAQSEHDMQARAILITDSEDLAKQVEVEINKLLPQLPRREIATQSLEKNGIIIIAANLEEAVMAANIIASEHLEIITNDPEAVFSQINNAGAVFLGAYSTEALGDYIAGASHVLPTNRAARFSSGLSVLDFMKRTSVTACTRGGMQIIGKHALRIAEAEELEAHAASIRLRLD